MYYKIIHIRMWPDFEQVDSSLSKNQALVS